MRCFVFIVSFITLAAGAAAPTECADIEDADARLACFDELYPGTKATDAQVTDDAPPIEDVPIAGPRASTDTAASAPEPLETVDLEDRAVPAPEPDAKPKRKWFSGFSGEKVEFTSTIKVVRRGDKQKMVFLLDNDEIWMQATPRPLPFDEGQTVTIRSAMMGGYFMSNEKGTRTRVQRIR